MIPVLLNVAFFAICLYFALKAPFKLYILGIVAVGFLIVVAIEIVSLATINNRLETAANGATLFIVIYIAILEELARLVIAVVLFRQLSGKGLTYPAFIFAGIAFGLYEYVFRFIGFMVGPIVIACEANIAPILCQNTVALAPFAMHIIASLTYSIVVVAKAAYRTITFLYAFFIAAILHSGHNIAYVTLPASDKGAAVYDFAVFQLSIMFAGVILAILVVKLLVSYTKRDDEHGHRDA